ncbi:MAG: type VI secretion system tip protein VgrG [Kangiella sp.]|nr:type VI secretion system tip protein VgrG [Kangiella sp.]
MGLFEKFSQTNRLIRVDTELGNDTLLLTKVVGHEALSMPYQFSLTCLSQLSAIDPNKLMGKAIDFSFELNDGGERTFNGIVCELRQRGKVSETLYQYELKVVPQLWLLSQRTNIRIYQHKTIPKIVEQLLSEHQVVFESKLTASYPVHEYCVQYQETDLDFVQRLLAEAGIFYYFKQQASQHQLILLDDKNQYESEGSALLSQSYGTLGSEHFSEWHTSCQLLPIKYTSNGYDFKNPTNSLRSDSEHSENEVLDANNMEVYRYPGDYQNKGEGQAEAAKRLEAIQKHQLQVYAESNIRDLKVGHIYSIAKHENINEVGNSYLVTKLEYYAEDDSYKNSSESKQEIRNKAQLIPSDVQFRPDTNYQKPSVKGLQSAVVTGPEGEEIYTDQYGRVRIQFHWDREGKKDENSSCWVRVSHQWAGAGFGGINIPRIGQEVLVEFEDGDPDKPIITGRVYNARNMPPYQLPNNKTQSGWVSRSTPDGTKDTANEIRFEDRKGAEHLLIHAERNQSIEVENEEFHWVGKNRRKTIDNDETVEVKNDRKEKVGNDEEVEIGNNQTLQIGNDSVLKVGKNRTVEIEKDSINTVNNHQKDYVHANHSQEVGGHYEHKVAGKYTLEAVEKIFTRTNKFILQASDSLEIAGPGGSIIIDSSGITIEGKEINIKGSAINLGSGSASQIEALQGAANEGLPFCEECESKN